MISYFIYIFLSKLLYYIFKYILKEKFILYKYNFFINLKKYLKINYFIKIEI